jgi:hypothetical protein|nr:MAG TPA: hypothetical protein [Bacteriophage sp.]
MVILFNARKAIIVFEKLKHEQLYWSQQELSHYPVYSREELIERIEYLEKETNFEKVYPLIKLAGRILSRFNKFHEMASKHASLEAEIEALKDEDWLLQKYRNIKLRILEHYRNNE